MTDGHPPRPEQVALLTNAAAQGMLPFATESSPSELISACFTLCKRMIVETRLRGGNVDAMKQSVMALLIECTDDRRPS